ncbi:MAG: Guanosine-5-triphosphate,3-diphosphate pyrophosphatase [Pseudomonadota bacterium]|jgi:exopolyphosphatase/guanosine-5'-triphosphate,3'-diphosphate pyrophosphatase
MTLSAAARQYPEGERPDRAVIDIGSNTVRMVIYSGPARAPEVWLNEKVSARLGRDLAASGRMPDKAMDAALAALARYFVLLSDLGIADVQTVATAAVRDAQNGGEFLGRVRAIGLHPRLLSGEEEARAAAMGVIGAFPGAQGTVADLGGGSLELVQVDGGLCHDGVSLPLGTLRLPALREKGGAAFGKAVKREMGKAGWAAAHPGPLYLVGGTWRAFALHALRQLDYPLTDPHGLILSVADVRAVAGKLAQAQGSALAKLPGVPAARAAVLPDAAAMLGVMLDELQPDGVVFSSWGLREGLLLQRLSPLALRQDPLLAAIGHFTGSRGGSPTLATMIAAWTTDIANGTGDGSERLRMAATMLSLAAARLEPNLRPRHAYDWAMDKRWVALDPAGRARIAAALLGSCGKPALPPQLLRLAGEADLREAAAWGLAVRLCRRLGAGTPASMLNSALKREDRQLVLYLDEDRAQLASDAVMSDLRNLAQWIGLEPAIRFGNYRAIAGSNRPVTADA